MVASADTGILGDAEAASESTKRLGSRWSLLWINLIGGPAVLGSYAWGFLLRSNEMVALWGGVPESIRPLYTINMFLAAAGYLAFTGYVFARLGKHEGSAARGLGAGVIPLLYVGVLLPSALWLPLTFEMIAAPSAWMWILIRASLGLVGLSAIALLVTLRASGMGTARGRLLALIAFLPFVFQTAVLDGLVWPAYFPGG